MAKEQLPNTTLVDGRPVTDDHKEINPATGQQKDYVVLSNEERAKGFVRPVRNGYVHVGRKPPVSLRPLTDEEMARYPTQGYVGFEPNTDPDSAVTGRFWTQEQLARVEGTLRCGAVTNMARTIAETYARDPHFYGGTFCARCKAHFPVGEKGEFIWDGTDERVGT